MRAFIAAIVVLLPRVDASADTLTATRGQDVRETAHRVDISVRDGVATYVVRRTFHNRGREAEEVRLDITLPHGAVATGLRIRARDRWYTGELMHARKAEELYRELTGLGPSEPKDPALLYWQWTGRLGLRVFPVFPGKSSTVEYTLTAPAGYSDGAYHVSYGREPDDPRLAAPVARVRGRGIKRVMLGKRAVRRSRIPLRRIALHPVLKRLGIDDPHTLVRSLAMPEVAGVETVEVKVDIAHSWRGDVELTLVSPDDKRHRLRAYDLSDDTNDLRETFTFKHAGSTRGTWHLLVRDHHPLDPGTLQSWALKLGRTERVDREPRPIPQPEDGDSALATLALVPARPIATRVRWGRVDLVEGKHFVNLEVDVARRLSELPAALSVVFVVDASHTMGREGIDAQLRLARAYLSHVPGARFALVGYGHRAEGWTSGFVAARAFEETVARLRAAGRLEPRNGSFLDRGLALARRMLASQGPRRQQAIVAMTDNRLRPAWTNGPAIAAVKQLAASAVVHLVDISEASELAVDRADKHRLFPLAKLRGGVAITAAGVGAARWQPLVRQALYLVRPTRIDNVAFPQLKGRDVLADGETSVAEGGSIRWLQQLASSPARVTLRGELWSRPVEIASHGDEPFNRATAGYVFSHDMFDDLSEAEQYVIASYGRAVSPVTSYLAIEPGVRPSTIGLESFGVGGSGAGGGGAYGALMGTLFGFDWKPIVARIERACRQHSGAAVSVKVTTQDHEIADVVAAAGGVFGACVVGRLWATRLPEASFSKGSEKTFALRFADLPKRGNGAAGSGAVSKVGAGSARGAR